MIKPSEIHFNIIQSCLFFVLGSSLVFFILFLILRKVYG